MSYDTFEQSVHDAAPIEVYKFIGSFETYRYTSYHEEVTVAGETYTPVPLKRSAVKVGTQEDSSLVLEVTIPFDLGMVIDYAYSNTPPSLRVEVRRVHYGSDFATDWRMLWSGFVTSFTVTGREAKITVPAIFDRVLRGDVPSAYYQTPCNHTLYDGRCGVSRAANTTEAVVVEVASLAIEVDNDGVADNALAAGEVINQRTGERRLIMSNVANTININFPFVDCQVGDEVQLAKGCDLAFSTCANVFSNGARFGGHPFMPGDNPYEGSFG